jgi:hypothetical protein
VSDEDQGNDESREPESGSSKSPGAADQSPKTFGSTAVLVVAVVAALVGGAVGYFTGAQNASSNVSSGEASSKSAPIEHLELGQTAATQTGSEVTALTWDWGSPGWPQPEPKGYRRSRAVVTFCAGPGITNFRIREIPYLFNLVDTNGQLINPFVDTYFALDELASYNVGLVGSGQCVTGSIIFLVPDNRTVSAIRFTGHGRFQWDLSQIVNGSPAPTPSVSPGLNSPRPSVG